MGVHADEHLCGLELLEGVLDAVGDVGGNAHLGLQVDIGACGIVADLIQQPLTRILVLADVLVVIHNVQRHNALRTLDRPHHQR